MDEIVKEFLVESCESLLLFDHDLISLEKNPRDRKKIARILRSIHTVKGRSVFLGFGKLDAVASICENLLGKLRDGVITFKPELTSALLAMADSVRYMLGQIEVTAKPGDRDFSNLINLLTRLNEDPMTESGSVASPLLRPVDSVAVTGVPDRATKFLEPEAVTRRRPQLQQLHFCRQDSGSNESSCGGDQSPCRCSNRISGRSQLNHKINDRKRRSTNP